MNNEIMNMTNSERAKKIRKEIKEKLGYTSRQVSVTNPGAIFVTIKAEIAIKDIKIIEEIASKYELIFRCKHTGEILEGGNSFIFVRIDSELKNKVKRG